MTSTRHLVLVQGEQPPYAHALEIGRVVFGLHDELVEMGRRGHAWMSRDFSWQHIASQMAEVYAWLDQAGQPPSTIQFHNV